MNEELIKILLRLEQVRLGCEQEIKCLTPTQKKYMLIINDNERISFSDIARITDNSKPTVSQSMNCLLEHGLIKKKPCSVDKRRYYLELTKEGKKVIYKDKLLFADILIENLSKEELEQLILILRKI